MGTFRAGIVWIVLGLLASSAHAGRTRFGWLYDTEVVPERSVEIETWVFEEDGKGDPDVDETNLWWAPVVGVTDRLELAFPVEITYEAEEDGAGNRVAATKFSRFGGEARWRLVTPDPVEAPAVVPLLRLAVKRVVTERDIMRLEGGLVVSYDLGPAHFAVDLGWLGLVRFEGDGFDFEARPGVGASIRVTEDLRIGGEFYAEIGIDEDDTVDWLSLGPNLSWTHGRYWLSASFPIGLSNIDAAPRLNWAVAF